MAEAGKSEKSNIIERIESVNSLNKGLEYENKREKRSVVEMKNYAQDTKQKRASQLSLAEGGAARDPIKNEQVQEESQQAWDVILSWDDTSPRTSSRSDEVNSIRERTPSHLCRVNGDICRICHEDDIEEDLISPCRCKGSLSLVHRACLERWLAEADSDLCELCNHVYITQRIPKYGVFESVLAWMKSSESRRDRREMLVDILAFCAFTPLAALGSYLGLLMAETLYNLNLDERALTQLPSRLATVSVISMMTTLDLAYFSWFILRLHHHFGQWYSWYRKNCKVRLIGLERRGDDSV